LSIKISSEETITVFSCNYNGFASTYKPGKWEEYLTKLMEKAQEEAEREYKQQEQKQQKLE